MIFLLRLFRRSDVQFIQPLTDTLKRDLNLVHLGGLTVLPAKNVTDSVLFLEHSIQNIYSQRLDVYTLNVEMQVTNSWDNEIKEIFKVIVDSSKRFVFIEEMVLGQHRFGMLRTELKNGKVVLINEILLQMNKAIACGPFVKGKFRILNFHSLCTCVIFVDENSLPNPIIFY